MASSITMSLTNNIWGSLSKPGSCLSPKEYSREACVRTHDCGHLCGGLKGENTCLPCLHGCSNNPSLKQDADDMCMICFSEALSAAPAIQVCKIFYHPSVRRSWSIAAVWCCDSLLPERWKKLSWSSVCSLCAVCSQQFTTQRKKFMESAWGM